MNNPITTTVNKIKIQITQGDIAKFPAAALLTPINSGGAWWGAIDDVIERHCGRQFHDQARARMPLQEGQTIYAKKRQNHRAAFGDVIFVIDDTRRPLREILLAGLLEAEAHGISDLSIPAMRTGVKLGMFERTLEATIRELAEGTLLFTDTGPKHLRTATFVVYNDQPTIEAMQNLLDCKAV